MKACSKTVVGSALFLIWMAGFASVMPAQDSRARSAPASPAAPAPESGGVDPFAGVSEAPKRRAGTTTSVLDEAAVYRKFRVPQGTHVAVRYGPGRDGRRAASRSGFEILKKFSTATSTVASFDFQGRLVRRDGYNPVINDMEGAQRRAGLSSITTCIWTCTTS